MADKELLEIQDKYVPFLKKLIAFLEKTNKATPENLTRLKSIYEVFTTASVLEQKETFQKNKKKLERWYKSTKKEKMPDVDSSSDSTKRPFAEDTDSSQGTYESAPKRSKSVAVKAPEPVFDPKLVSQIKKEKSDAPKVPAVSVSPKTIPMAKIVPTVTSPVVSSSNVNDAKDTSDAVVFTCASCQFQTQDEQEFMKHTRTDHRSDLSMWCKHCGKCFSNAGVLVTHIKERGCVREEMIYRCGVKDCTFETTSGQTFVHHLRHCHKGSPFIFCVHCQKIFTLPHCLILHMQDDCPFKDKNRRNPGSAPPPAAPAVSTPTPPSMPVRPQSFPTRTPTISSVTSAVPRPVTAVTPSLRMSTPTATRGRGALMPTARGSARRGGRGRGRGRSRAQFESSESDEDADDPSWKPEEATGQQMLRRSGRWAKKVNDVVNAETVDPKTKGLTYNDMSKKEMQKCPCCEFMAAFQSVMQDHYIAHHKVPNRNACQVCHLKFEATQNFLDHFVDHANGKLTNEPSLSAADSPVSAMETDADTKSVETGAMIALDKESIKGVVKNISEANVGDKSNFVRIPYQAAIQDKSSKDNKLKKFEELKAPSDLVELRKPEKLKCFFKCILYSCSFATSDSLVYTDHLISNHKGRRLHCSYCVKEFFAAEPLTEHLLSEHSKRQFQCSTCFYRAYSKIHVQIHIKHTHANDINTGVMLCDPVSVPANVTVKSESGEVQNTTWPYVCAIGECAFQSFDPKDFRVHNETAHRSVSVFFCHYCKVDFLSFKRLQNHYRLHGINTFQCNYCIHGSESKDEILLHLCNAHPDRPLQAFMRGSEEDVSTEAQLMPFSLRTVSEASSVSNNVESPRPESPSVELDSKSRIDFESLLYEVIGETYYPKYLRKACSDFTCGIPFCLERFDTLSVYMGHLKNAHSIVNFPCPHCPDVSESWEDFKNHLLCHGPELYSCGLVTCSFYNWDKHVVTDHLKVHSNSAAKVVILREEESGEASDISIIKMLPLKCPYNTDVEESFQCCFCAYKSCEKEVMEKHLYEEFLYKRFTCLFCNERFTRRKEIQSHSLKFHSDQEINCSVEPNPLLENIVQFLLHNKKIHTDTTNKTCSICSKGFKSAAYLHAHVRLCAQNRYQPFSCDYCMQSFSDLKIYKFHLDESHPGKPTALFEISSYLVENEVEARLQQIRLNYIKETLGDEMPQMDPTPIRFVKSYLCGLCPYESNHKGNVEKHHEAKHAGVPLQIKREMRNMNASEFAAPAKSAETPSSDEPTDGVKRYRCGFCIKKLFTLLELENHVESLHPLQNEVEYLYFYTPDSKAQFVPDDKELYECAYCKSSRENLHSLKTHSDLMHSDSIFRVKGKVTRNGEMTTSNLACGYCYQRVDTVSDLKQHTTAHHASLPQKSVGGFRGSANKRLSDDDDIPNKRVRFAGQAFVCTPCGAAFSSHELIVVHGRKVHPRIKMEFSSLCNAAGDTMPRFYKCEFCQFTSEKQHLDKHLGAKHKNRVTCEHCNKRFEFATKLRQHHDLVHADLPIKYRQETLGKSSIKREAKGSTPKLTHEVMDLNSVYVCVNNKGTDTRMSVLDFAQKHDIYPKLTLEKCSQLMQVD